MFDDYDLTETQPETACVDIAKYTELVRKATLLDFLIAYKRSSPWGVDGLVTIAEIVAGYPIELKVTDVMPDSGADTETPAEKVSEDA